MKFCKNSDLEVLEILKLQLYYRHIKVSKNI